MGIPIAILADYLRTMGDVLYIADSSREFTRVERFAQKEHSRDNVIYVCTPVECAQTSLSGTRSSHFPPALLCAIDPGHNSCEDFVRNCESIKIIFRANECNADLGHIIDCAQNFIGMVLSWQYDMANSMLCGGMYQEMIDLSDLIFADAIYICDSHHRLVACSQSKRHSNKYFAELAKSGRLERKSITELQDDGFLTEGSVPRSYRALSINSGSKQGFINRVFRVNGAFHLHLFMVRSSQPITQGFTCLFNMLAESIGHCVAKDSQQKAMRNRFGSDFLIPIILREKQATESDDACALEAGINLEAPLCLYLIRGREEMAPGLYADFLSDMFPLSMVTAIGGKLIMVRNNMIERERASQEQNFLKEFLEQNSLCAGASSSFFGLKNIYYGFLQAKMALDLLEKIPPSKTAPLSFFHTKATLCLLHAGEKERDEMLRFLATENAILAKLGGKTPKEKDNILLLFHYLRCDGDIPKLSEYQRVHRNTTYYRLKKIEGSLGMKLEDFGTRRFLELLFDAMMLEGRFQP